VSEPSLDPAQQSLANALRLSFGILKFVMLCLAVFFVVSGSFTVDQKQAALVLRFGRPLGGVDTPVVYEPGLHFALPYPIDRKIEVALAKETLQIESFFFHVPENQQHLPIDQLQVRYGGLQPGLDGMLLTADLNVIHARWFVEYRVADPVAYVRNVYLPLGADRSEEEQYRQNLVRSAVQNACVRTVAAFRADDILFGGQIDEVQRLIKTRAQQTLDRFTAGIVIDQLLVREPTAPLQVRQAFLDVLNADQEKQKAIEQAIKQANTILNSAAGVAYQRILPLLDQYEQARQANQDAQAEPLRQQIEDLLLTEAGGEASRMILEARTYYTETVQSIQATARKFEQLLPEYRRNPEIVLIQLWSDTKRQVLSGDVEKIYLPSGAKQIRAQIGRNPDLFRQRELRKYQQQTQQE
jgi:membrane protease subunit HflK